MKLAAFFALPVLTLVLMGAVLAGGMQTAECRACEIEESPVAAIRDDDNDYTQSGVDNFLPDDDVFGQDNGGLEETCGRGGRHGRKPSRPEPRDKDDNKYRPMPVGESGESSPNGDIYFVIYGHLPLPPAPQPPVPEAKDGEIPEAELG